jgi:coatomer subunit alpha
LVNVAREYLIGLKMEILRKETADPKRGVELAAYFTHCELQPAHLQIVLSVAMMAAYKAKNFDTASQFARRLLELGPVPKSAEKVFLFPLTDKRPSNPYIF